MFCHKCGTEIPSAEASFCINCREPLLKIPSSADQPSTDSGSENRDPQPSSINLAFGDDDEALKMSDPIDFLMQEEEEEKNKVPDRYKEEFQDGFQDEFQEEVQQDENQDETHHDIPEGFQDENRDEVQTGNQDEYQDETQTGYRDENQYENQGWSQDDNRQETQDMSQDENRDETQAGTQDENRDEAQVGTQDENLENDRDWSQAEHQDNTQENFQGEQQYTTQDESQEHPQADSAESSEEQTPAEPAPVRESTDKIKPSEGVGPEPVYTGGGGESSAGYGYSGSKGQSNQAVETIPRKKEEKPTPPPLEVPKMEDPNKGENIIATAKIKVDKPITSHNPELKFASASSQNELKSPRQPSDPNALDITKIRRSNGIAYLSGNNISLAGGPKISSGDRIQIGESTYEVKIKPKNKNELYSLIGSVALALFITFYFLGAFSSSNSGNLVGLVVGSDSRPLPGQEVRIKETGDKFTTNSAGLFIFENLSEGIYTVEYLLDDKIVGEERITVLGGKTSTVRISRNSSRSLGDAGTKPAARPKPAKVVTVASSGGETAAVKKK